MFLLDEPFAGIDPIAVADLQETVAQLKRNGIGVLITDHNVRETLKSPIAPTSSAKAASVAGTPANRRNPVARRTYLGERFRMDFDGGDAAQR